MVAASKNEADTKCARGERRRVVKKDYLFSLWRKTHRYLYCQKFFIKQLSRNNDDEYLKDEKIRRESSEQSQPAFRPFPVSFLKEIFL